VFGNNASNHIQKFGTTGADTLTGTSADDAFAGMAGDDNIIGAGGADILLGGAGKDKISIADTGFHLIDGGGGIDTLLLNGAELSLNLVTLRPTIQNIEIFDLTGTGNNELTLNAAIVLAMSNTSNVKSQSNTLTVLGNAGDIVHLGTGWTDGGIASGLHKYSMGQAVVLVGTAVTVDSA
jgi:Ca2+-binding RTX toxin-like protein